LTEQQRACVEESVHHCLIKNTLLHPPKIAIEIKQPVATSN
jgi:putative redox protein